MPGVQHGVLKTFFEETVRGGFAVKWMVGEK